MIPQKFFLKFKFDPIQTDDGELRIWLYLAKNKFNTKRKKRNRRERDRRRCNTPSIFHNKGEKQDISYKFNFG